MDTRIFVEGLNGVSCKNSIERELKYSEAWLADAGFGRPSTDDILAFKEMTTRRQKIIRTDKI